MSTVKQEFQASGEESILRALDEIAKRMGKVEDGQNRILQSSQKAHDQEKRNFKETLSNIDEWIRRTRELKQARDQLNSAYKPNFTMPGPGGAMVPAPNFTRQQKSPVTSGNGFFADIGRAPSLRALQWPEMMAGRAQNHLDSLAGPIQNFGRGLMQTAAGFVTAEALIQGFNRALEISIERQNRAFDASQDLASAQAELALNTYGQGEDVRQMYRSAATRISDKSGVPEPAVLRSLARQAGRGASLPPEQVIGSLEVATLISRHNREQLGPTGAGIQQIMEMGGVGPMEAAALFQSAAAAAYPDNPELQARMIQQSIASASANSPIKDIQTAEEIAEYTAAASRVGGETRGESVRTAMTALLAQTNEFREGRGAWATHAMGMEFKNPIKGMPLHPREAMEYINANPRLKESFWSKATFERQYEGVLKDMLTNPQGISGNILADTQKAVGIHVPHVKQLLKDLEDSTPQIKAAVGAAASGVVSGQFSARDQIQARLKTLRENRDKGIDTTAELAPFGIIGSVVNEGPLRALQDLADMSGTPEGKYLGQLKARRDAIQSRRGTWEAFGVGPSKGETDASIAYLDKLIEQNQKMVEEIQALRREMTQSQPSAGPALQPRYGASGSW